MISKRLKEDIATAYAGAKLTDPVQSVLSVRQLINQLRQACRDENLLEHYNTIEMATTKSNEAVNLLAGASANHAHAYQFAMDVLQTLMPIVHDKRFEVFVENAEGYDTMRRI